MKISSKSPSLYSNLNYRAGSIIKKGLIIIPDISGYSEFVHQSDFLEGQSITRQLLLCILEHNILNLEVSEIEGDAILFYKMGEPASVTTILKQYEYMLAGFNRKLKELSQEFHSPFKLSLKFIAHYGEISEYNIGGFKKLYGESIIEAHRLLKNSINSHTYALLTDDLVKAALPEEEEEMPEGVEASKLCEVYGNLRNICFIYFDYAPKRVAKMIA